MTLQNPMNYNIMIESLNHLTLFDLYRLKQAIQYALEDENRLEAIKSIIAVGQQVRYFHGRENREVIGEILKIKRTSVLIKSDHDHSRWNVPLCALNLQAIDCTLQLSSKKRGAHRDTLKVGDTIGFRNHGQDVYGLVKKLNPKTAEIELSTGKKWRVYYEHLFQVIDGKHADINISGGCLLLGEVIESTIEVSN